MDDEKRRKKRHWEVRERLVFLDWKVVLLYWYPSHNLAGSGHYNQVYEVNITPPEWSFSELEVCG